MQSSNGSNNVVRYLVSWINDYDKKEQNIFYSKEKAEKEFESLQNEGYDCWISIVSSSCKP